LSSKQERERRRLERVEAEQREAAAERRRLMLGYVVAGVLTLAVGIGIVVVIAGSGGGDDEVTVDGEELPQAAHIEVQSGSVNGIAPDGREGTPPPAVEQGDLRIAADEAGCELDLDLPDEGNTHIQPNDDPPDYKTNPPTSGNHIVPPRMQADGAYIEYPDPVYTVHSLEHGRIDIQYSPDLPEDQQLELKGLFDEDFDGMLLFPNPDMPFDVAATAWTQLIRCPTYEGRATLDALRAFRDTYRGQGPEPVPVVIPDT
jgi:Protein of unknown function (DUF3105)